MPESPSSMTTAAEVRSAWMGVLARATPEHLAQLWADQGAAPAHEWLRAPEIGTVMLRGRAGATGAPFNLGEMTVTRASVRLGCGAVGHAWVQGRSTEHAAIAALVDALMQTERAAQLRDMLIVPLEHAETVARSARAARAAATKVDFFTMVRGEG